MDTVKRLAGAAALVIALWGHGLSGAHANESVRLDVRITNYAGVADEDLARARVEVERIFADAGIAVTWVEQDTPGRIAILLLTITRDSQEHTATCALGIALAAKSTAYVFINRIIRTTERGAVDRPVVVARVIAHEIGHILMPGRKHASFGIMRGEVDLGYANPSRFSDDEARAMRRRVRESATSPAL